MKGKILFHADKAEKIKEAKEFAKEQHISFKAAYKALWLNPIFGTVKGKVPKIPTVTKPVQGHGTYKVVSISRDGAKRAVAKADKVPGITMSHPIRSSSKSMPRTGRG